MVAPDDCWIIYFVVTFAQLMSHMRILHYVIPCFGIVFTSLSSVDPTNTSPNSTTAKIGQNLERPSGAGWYSRMNGRAIARMMVMV
jgi:nucleoside permease NupC